MSKGSISVLPATADDFATLAKIEWESFAGDRNTELKRLYGHYNDQSTDGFEAMAKKPEKFSILKAVDDETGEIMGSIVWIFYGYDTKKLNEDKKSVAAPDNKDKEKSPEPEKSEADMDPCERMEKLTDADMQRWQEILMPPDTKCMIICGISVGSKFQSRGVGTALIRYGTSRADADGVFCWVHSSEAGYHVFKKNGFEVVGTLEMDLDEYATVPQPGGSKWGLYTFRYMKRLPR
jgi:hypothetical protein